MIKILAIHSANHPSQDKRSGVDQWRLYRPLRELRKLCPTWQVDEQLTIIKDIEGYSSKKEFTQAEMEAAFENVCKYDIVLTSYQSNPTFYTMLKVAEKRAGVQYIMDVDDNMFAIDPNNPVWAVIGVQEVYHMQCMIRDNTWISTTTEDLAKEFRARRKGHHKDTVLVNPNYISDDYQATPPSNGDRLVIGFFGGSSHYGDLHNTGLLEALQRLMHEHKHVYFKSVGIPIDTYLPRGRVTVGDAKKGDAWLHDIYPGLQLDIALGPLEDTIFNVGKSNIKWQEATRAGSLFVCSNIGPYSHLLPGTALKCRNTSDDWYRVLSLAVQSAELRSSTVKEAQNVLASSYRLEDHANDYKRMLEFVHAKALTPKPAIV
jgi:hypothetical protein